VPLVTAQEVWPGRRDGLEKAWQKATGAAVLASMALVAGSDELPYSCACARHIARQTDAALASVIEASTHHLRVADHVGVAEDGAGRLKRYKLLAGAGVPREHDLRTATRVRTAQRSREGALLCTLVCPRKYSGAMLAGNSALSSR
jgi:hypothetical protein